MEPVQAIASQAASSALGWASCSATLDRLSFPSQKQPMSFVKVIKSTAEYQTLLSSAAPNKLVRKAKMNFTFCLHLTTHPADRSGLHVCFRAFRIPTSTVKVTRFRATWCGPCQMMKPVYAELSSKYRLVALFTFSNGARHSKQCFFCSTSHVTFAAVDVDQLQVHTLWLPHPQTNCLTACFLHYCRKYRLLQGLPPCQLST